VKSRFFTNITHEFRTPLTLIISPLERLLNAGDLQEAHKEQLRMIGQNADQLLQLVNQFLDLSKLEAGVARTAVAPAPLRSYIESIVRLFQDAASSKRIDLSFQSELGDELYLIDPEKLERIVNNLLSNAIKFTPAGGSVRVVLGKSTVHGPPPIAIGATADDSTADLISLKIVDTGIGITPESQEKIFDRFYQADDGATGHHAGAGIGLSLVKELTTLLKGTVSVESKVGTGTVFTVTLPLARPVEYAKLTSDNFDQVVATEPLHTDRETKSGPESKPVILIAEDHESLRGFLAEQLGRAYTVVTAADGREAWKKILQIMPALVITDVMMPYLDGISLSKQLRETEQTGHIGLIMLTAKASAESRMEGLQTGANDYIAKPFHFEELQLRVANLLAHQQRQRDYFYSQLVKDNPAPAAGVVENEFLEKAYLFLEDALTSKKSIGVEDVASHFSMSSRTLNRKLQALVGLTANEFMRTYRLSRATVLLRRGATVSEAAYEVGFESSQYFAQCFKTQYKITPTEYIQQHRATINPT
jgi:DNA-binding response OmpR family regulator/two-component sensor histidine kinase